MTQTTLDRAMAYLYEHEINSRVDCFWDSGFTVLLGDHMNGFKHGKEFEAEELHLAGDWLIQKAKEVYPKYKWRKDD